jgi:hypothetical protein
MSIVSSWPQVLLNSAMCLRSLCLPDVPISETGVLKSPTIIVKSCIFPHSSITFCLIYFDTLLLGANTVRLCFLGELILYHHVVPFFLFIFISIYSLFGRIHCANAQ